MHDEIFRSQGLLDPPSFRQRAQAIALDLRRFDTCLQGEAAGKVRSDEAGGQALAVSGTPTFFIGVIQADGRVKVVRRSTGALRFEQFQGVIDQVLGSK